MHAKFLAYCFGFFTIGIVWHGMEFMEHFFPTGGKERDQGSSSTFAGAGSMRYAARQKDGCAGIGGDAAVAHFEIHVAFDNVKNRIFLGMKMQRNTAPGPIALFDQRESATGLGAIEF